MLVEKKNILIPTAVPKVVISQDVSEASLIKRQSFAQKRLNFDTQF